MQFQESAILYKETLFNTKIKTTEIASIKYFGLVMKIAVSG